MEFGTVFCTGTITEDDSMMDRWFEINFGA